MNAAGLKTPSSVVVITKHNFMGDTIVAVPLLRGIRQAFGQAHVTLLTGAMAAVALKCCPAVDQVLTYAPKTERGIGPFLRLLRSLKGETGRPDLCLVVDRSIRSGVIARATGARIRAGFDTEGRRWMLTHPVPYDPHTRREIESCLDVLRAVAPESEYGAYDPRPQLWITEEERTCGARILREHEAAAPVLIGIQPGASYDGKQWATGRFAALADALAGDGRAGIVVLGSGEREAEIARTMRAAMAPTTPVVDLTNRTKLRETMGVLPHLSLFVGNDTGVSHMAASLGVPTVQLFGPTSARKWGHVGPRNRFVDGPGDTLDSVSVDEVLGAARDLLTVGPAPPQGVATVVSGGGRR